MIRRHTLVPFCWLAALGGCTPVGLWLWQEPAIEVARLRIDDQPARDSAVTVALSVRNPNDYDLSTARFELMLLLDGQPVGHYERDSIIPLARSGADTLSLPFHPSAGTTPGTLVALRTGTRRFVVQGRAVLKTPFGYHPVRVDHAGDMAMSDAAEPAGGEGSQAHPGLPTIDRLPAVWQGSVPRPRRY